MSKKRFDFYLPNLNICIEFDGRQHYNIDNSYFGGEEEFLRIKERDGIKNQYCKDNDITLIRIPYWDIENIDKILKEKLCKQ